MASMNVPVPITTKLESLYPPEAIQTQKKRWDHLVNLFKDKYNQTPLFVARSPGRVNIIGEHIDYSLYEVLPMAIAADLLIAVSHSNPQDSTESQITISNVNSQFKPAIFTIPKDGDVEIDASTHEWTNYFRAGLNGALKLLRKNPFSPRNLQVLVDGSVPVGGGLSSSAAFVCASALAALRANGMDQISKHELVELAIKSERSVGVNSGGMDQAASVLSIKGDALSVSFSPHLHAEPIAFPKLDPPITFMIAQTFVAADKHVTAPECYNLRVVECTLAAEVMAASVGLNLQEDASPLGHSLRGFQSAYFTTDMSPQTQLQTLLSLIPTLLPNQSYTLSEIASILSTSPASLLQRLTAKFPIRASHFHLAKRATHVFSEALRVLEFKSLLRSSPPDLLPRLGTLMNKTQASCRDDYDCSCPELDQMCDIARQAGAYGSRLTGAGWGGCSVHLVPKGKVDEVREAWMGYYRNKGIGDLDYAVVVSEPGQGSMM